MYLSTTYTNVHALKLCLRYRVLSSVMLDSSRLDARFVDVETAWKGMERVLDIVRVIVLACFQDVAMIGSKPMQKAAERDSRRKRASVEASRRFDEITRLLVSPLLVPNWKILVCRGWYCV